MLSNITANTFLQLKSIIMQLSDEQYSYKLPILSNSTIGQHVRHVLEFYTCLAEGITIGNVDYDNRKRNHKIENDPTFALFILEELTDIFCNKHIEEKFITNKIEYNGETIEASSSINRELIYLIEHSIHHYAIIQIALKNDFPHIIIPEGFGIAYSTIKHKHENKEAALSVY